MGIFKTGYTAALLLAIITIAEYVFAVNTGDAQVKFVVLAAAAVAKVYLIMVFFMHIKRLWSAEGTH